MTIYTHHHNRYLKFIESRKHRTHEGVIEKHHIIPKSMGGDNNLENIIELTPREHYIAHWMLWKAYRNKSMSFAFWSMSNNGKGKINSKTYAAVREDFIEKVASPNGKVCGHTWSAESKQKRSEHYLGENNPFYGKTHTEETKQRISKALQGENSPFYGKRLTKEQLSVFHSENRGNNWGVLNKGKKHPKVECPHCGKIGGGGNMKRYHFDNCGEIK